MSQIVAGCEVAARIVETCGPERAPARRGL